MSCATVVEQKLNRCIILLQCHVVDAVALIFQKCQLIGWHDFSWYRASLHFLGWLISMLNQSCIALVAINLSTSMNCQREYNFPFVKNLSSFPSWIWLILVIIVFRFTDGQIICKTRRPDPSNTEEMYFNNKPYALN